MEWWAWLIIIYIVFGFIIALVDMGFTMSTAGQVIGNVTGEVQADPVNYGFNFAKNLFVWPIRLFGG
jgi:uncharacterized protein involved in cysteine biosynthesis